MADQFDLFRLSLLARFQRQLFAGADETREQHLRTVFSAPRNFTFYRTIFHYVPEVATSQADIIIGRIGRQVVVEENRPPEEGLVDSVHDGWKAAVILIDPRHSPDGQKVAVQNDPKVGKPLGLIKNLVDSINFSLPDLAWQMEIEAITSAQSFWDFADKNRGQITRLTFEFVAPNMFGGTDDLSSELRAFREKERAEKVAIALSSKNGLDTNTDRTKEAVEYAVKGAGTIRAKTRSGRRFNSNRTTETVKIDEDDLSSEAPVTRFARLANRILGRD